MNITFSFDSSVSSAPAAFTTALNQVASWFSTTFVDPVTVRIAVGWGEVAGQALDAGALAETFLSLNTFSYSQIRQALSTDAQSSVDASAVASLPAAAPVTGQYQLSLAEAKAVGLSNSTGNDGSIGFSTSSFDYDNSNGISGGTYDFFGVAAHEISHVLGWGIALVGQSGRYTLEDLFHFSAQGQRVFTAHTGYFSADNGATNLGTFNTSGSGDIGAWDSSMAPDSFRASAPSGVVLPVTANDIKVMDALGWDVSPAPADMTAPTLASMSPADNSTNVAVGANLVLNFSEAVKAGSGNVVLHRASDGSAAASIGIGDASQVSISGSAVTINPGSDLTAGTHYYVTIDSGAIRDLAGNSFAGISANTAFDFTTAATPIETAGGTTLATADNHFFLLDDSTGLGPSLKYKNADVVAGQFGGWAPIGAEKIASGYEIAWKMSGADQYLLWGTNSNGNFTAHLSATVTGADPALISAEPLFQQDLNGDGHIGNAGPTPPVTPPIETDGGTTLATADNHFFLLDDSTGLGPSLKYKNADVVAGQFGGWAPIGAEKIASGYEIAWKMSGADQYLLWGTNSNGNFTAHLSATVTGADPALISAEPLFQQDLNNDGHIGSALTALASDAGDWLL